MGNGETLPIEHTLPIREFVAYNSCIRSNKFVYSRPTIRVFVAKKKPDHSS
jgi:hypothetical protein